MCNNERKRRSPSAQKSNLEFSFAELIILTLLEKKDIYGYEFVPLLETVSGGRLIVTESTLYPTYRNLDSHYISDREERAGKRRIRVYYHLEPEGLARLNNLREEYQNLRDGIDAMLACEALPCEDGES